MNLLQMLLSPGSQAHVVHPTLLGFAEGQAHTMRVNGDSVVAHDLDLYVVGLPETPVDHSASLTAADTPTRLIDGSGRMSQSYLGSQLAGGGTAEYELDLPLGSWSRLNLQISRQSSGFALKGGPCATTTPGATIPLPLPCPTQRLGQSSHSI